MDFLELFFKFGCNFAENILNKKKANPIGLAFLTDC